MMTSKFQGNRKKKPYLIFGILIMCFLVACEKTTFQSTSQMPPTVGQPTNQVIHINIPTVQYPTIPPSAPAYTLPILSIGLSGVTGTVTFEDISGAVAILLRIDGLPEESLAPVELRYGTCATLGSLAYPLVSPDGGESETDLSINLNQFNTQKPMAVILYRSTQDRTAIACGDIP